MVIITLDKEVTFELPEGEYAAQLSGIKPFIKQTSRGKQDWIRLLFDVKIPDMQDLDCRAGRNFSLNFKTGSDLRNFLTSVLGAEFFKNNSAKNIDLEKILVGQNGVVTLRHFTGVGYEKPMVVVETFEVEGKDWASIWTGAKL